MRCEDCRKFNAESGACRDGKVNPRSMSDAIEVAQAFGPRAVCTMNEFRERLLDIRAGAPLPGRPERRPGGRRRWTEWELR